MTEPYIQCAGARSMDLLNPKMEDINLPSMAYALAHLNRYTGHAGVYSVAEHLVLGTRYLEREGASVAAQVLYLFHDAHEAYTNDVSQPAKVAMRAICERNGFGDFDPWQIFEGIHMSNVRSWLLMRCNTSLPPMKGGDKADELAASVDLRMLITETNQLAKLGGRVGPGWPNVDPVHTEVEQWEGQRAFAEFLSEVARVAPELVL